MTAYALDKTSPATREYMFLHTRTGSAMVSLRICAVPVRGKNLWIRRNFKSMLNARIRLCKMMKD